MAVCSVAGAGGRHLAANLDIWSRMGLVRTGHVVVLAGAYGTPRIGDSTMKTLKAVGLGFLGGVVAIGLWIALDASGLIRGLGLQGQNAAFEQRVRDYLIENPQVLVESLQRMQERQRASQTDGVARIIASRSEEIFNDPTTPVGGNPQGDVSLVEFFDYNCPYCRRVASTLAQIEESDPNLRIVYKEWPILGQSSVFAARAALASRKQDKYAAFHNALMQASRRVDEGTVLEIAAQVGLDVAQLKQDMEAPEITRAITRNRELAKALRISGTPSFVIGDQILKGAAGEDLMRRYIREARRSDPE